ncbi:MAG TPA: hypothetical protein VFJ99_00105 [Solirubrobacterales bacterium]|nr:hypothetical protein [Solirubrobacterales bacterium]
MRRLARLTGMALLLLPLHAGAAYGGTGNPSDPEAGSPGAAVYQLPLEKGRADAAPQGDGGLEFPGAGGGSAGAKGGASQDESFYRSENNFGSSAHVPGASAASGSGSGGSNGSGAAAGGGEPTGAPGGSSPGNRLASRSVDPPADTGNTSLAANVALLAAILLLATGVGVAGARMSRSRPRE